MKYLLLLIIAVSGTVQSMEYGQVVEVIPNIQIIDNPVETCEDIVVKRPQSVLNAGTVTGSIVGGALGSLFGGGNGRIVTTVIGTTLGGAVGNSVYSSNTEVKERHCRITNTRIQHVVNHTVKIRYKNTLLSEIYEGGVPLVGSYVPLQLNVMR